MKGLKRRRGKSGKSRPEDRAAARQAHSQQFSRVMTVAASATVFAALAAGLLIGIPHLQSKLATRAAGPVRIVFDWPGAGGGFTWLPQSAQDELLAAAYGEIERNPDPFSPDGLRLIGETASVSGWFERVRAVRRESDGIIHIDGIWRVPVGVVRRDGTDYLVAKGGEILPLTFEPGKSGFKTIVGAQLNPTSQSGRIVPGTVWPGADVKAGLQLLTLISTKPWQYQVASIDVSEYLSAKSLVLNTTRRGRIIWGGGPSDAIPGQVSTAAKLLRLDGLYQQHQMIDAGHRAVWVSGPVTTVDDSATADAS